MQKSVGDPNINDEPDSGFGGAEVASSDENFLPTLLEECVDRCRRLELEKRRLRDQVAAVESEKDALARRLESAEARVSAITATESSGTQVDCAADNNGVFECLRRFLDAMQRDPEACVEFLDSLTVKPIKTNWKNVSNIVSMCQASAARTNSHIAIASGPEVRDLEYWSASCSRSHSSALEEDVACWRTESGNSFCGTADLHSPNVLIREISDVEEKQILQHQPAEGQAEMNRPTLISRLARGDSRSTAIVHATISGRHPALKPRIPSKSRIRRTRRIAEASNKFENDYAPRFAAPEPIEPPVLETESGADSELESALHLRSNPAADAIKSGQQATQSFKSAEIRKKPVSSYKQPKAQKPMKT